MREWGPIVFGSRLLCARTAKWWRSPASNAPGGAKSRRTDAMPTIDVSPGPAERSGRSPKRGAVCPLGWSGSWIGEFSGNTLSAAR